MEYLIEVKKGNEVTHVVNVLKDKSVSLSVASYSGYQYATKFKVKDRALKVAAKIEGAQVVHSFGGYVNSSKTSVAPIQSKVNGKSAYRSI
jgi:preprotein translocase subunit SecD